MALNALDFDAAAVDAQDKIAKWEAEFQQRFNAPLVEIQKMQSLAQMHPTEVQILRQQHPEVIDKMTSRIQSAQQGD